MQWEQNQEAQTITFTETAFQKRFGLALLASLGLHALMFAFAPGILPTAAPTGSPAMNTLVVGLVKPGAGQGHDVAAVPQPQATRQPQIAQTTQNRIQEPIEPAMVSMAGLLVPDASPAATAAPAAPATAVPAIAAPSTAGFAGPLVPSVDQGDKAADLHGVVYPDAALIGEQFKQAFMDLIAYPEAARRRGVQGTVGLRIAMSADGRITDATVSQTSGSSILDQAAVEAALATPGPLAGPGRRLELTLRISFQAGRVLAGP